MYVSKTLPNGKPLRIVVCDPVEDRLKGTCFRGVNVPLAGTFRFWNTASWMLSDVDIMNGLLCNITANIGECPIGVRRCTFEDAEYIGWASTDSLKKYRAEQLEERSLSKDNRPNPKAWAMFVKDQSVLAPLTRMITFGYNLQIEGNDHVAYILTVYPGEDVGNLMGNMTLIKGVVFFSWDHPGAPV